MADELGLLGVIKILDDYGNKKDIKMHNKSNILKKIE